MELKLDEIAHRLNLPKSTLIRWIRQGRIPVQMSGDFAIFKESVLKEWAVRHHLTFSSGPENTCVQITARPETLLAAMQAGCVFHHISGGDGESALASAVREVPGLAGEDRAALHRRLVEREQLTSTGIGRGVAIPHPRSPLGDEMGTASITTCFLDQPIDFGAIDDKPVFVFFLLLSPSVKIHLHLLSRLAFCVRDNAFVDFLRTLPAADALFLKIAEFETMLEDSES